MSQSKYFRIFVKIDLDLEDRLLFRIDTNDRQILADRRAHVRREHRQLDLDLSTHNTERFFGRHDQTLSSDVANMIAWKKEIVTW